MSIVRRIRWGRVFIALTLVLVASFLIFGRHHEDKSERVPSPREYNSDFWDQTIGGDQPLTEETWKTLDDPTRSDLGEKDARSAAAVAKDVLKADKTGVGRERWENYWSVDSKASTCSNFQIKAASAMKLPVGTDASYSKVLIAWEGDCSGGELEIGYIYERQSGDSWVPVREWEIPSYDKGEDTGPAAEPASWELKELTCGDTSKGEQAKIIVADAWDIMCKDASKEGVKLEVTSAYRNRQEQVALYKRAISFYGSEKEAARWVAPADENTCSSKHCSGTAINVDSAGLQWLNQIVGCNKDGAIVQSNKTCPAGQGTVRKMNLYGFAAPVSYVPTYLEFILPVEYEKANADCHPQGSNVPTMVAQIFRCRLEEAGLDTKSVDSVVAQALVVSRCESGWNPDAMAYGGRFRNEPNPISSKTYSQAGVFMLTSDEANYLIEGGYSNVSDPGANINAAASIWLLSGWERWGCATGNGELFEEGPVLPEYGGPALPQWAQTY